MMEAFATFAMIKNIIPCMTAKEELSKMPLLGPWGV
jgi:hypothetical protein